MKFLNWIRSIFGLSPLPTTPSGSSPTNSSASSSPSAPSTVNGKKLRLSDYTEGTKPAYRVAYALMTFDAGLESTVRSAANTVLKGKKRYQEVCRRLGWKLDFWWIIGVIHFKECSCDFTRALHNGDRVIGNGKKTWQVPAGRGPFATWEDAAVDAISMNGSRWTKIAAGNGEIGEVFYAMERYNGTGYLTGAGKAEWTPYLWAMTSINDNNGKYVADGKFDPNATTQKACGIAAMVKELSDRGEIVVNNDLSKLTV